MAKATGLFSFGNGRGAPRAQAAERPPRSGRAASLMLCGLFCGLVAAGAGLEIRRSYEDELAQEAQRLKNSTYLIGEWIKGAFRASDYVLRDITSAVDPAELRHPAPSPARHAERSRWLADKRDTVPGAYLIGLLDRDCVLTHSPQPNAPLGFDASGRDYCRLLRDDPGADSVVTPLFFTNFGRHAITQARRIRGDDGRFLGVATLGVDAAMFSQLIDHIETGPGGIVTIVDARLRLVARKPALPDAIGRQLGDATIRAFVASGASFSAQRRTSTVDGQARLVGLHKVGGLPLIVSVGVADAVWLAGWHRRIAEVLVVALLLMAAALAVLRHHWRQQKATARWRSLAGTDALTGLGNRRQFLARAQSELRRGRYRAAPLAIVMIDLDRFKPINDEHGHAAGDRALKAFTTACRSALRDSDLLARLGGDEFAALLTDVDADDAARIVERVRRAVEAAPVQADDGTPIPLTASLGAVLVEAGAASLDQALARADGLLYAAKQAGRNQACIRRLEATPDLLQA